LKRKLKSRFRPDISPPTPANRATYLCTCHADSALYPTVEPVYITGRKSQDISTVKKLFESGTKSTINIMKQHSETGTSMCPVSEVTVSVEPLSDAGTSMCPASDLEATTTVEQLNDGESCPGSSGLIVDRVSVFKARYLYY